MDLLLGGVEEVEVDALLFGGLPIHGLCHDGLFLLKGDEPGLAGLYIAPCGVQRGILCTLADQNGRDEGDDPALQKLQVCSQQQVANTIVTGKDYSEILQSIQTLHCSGSVDGFIMLYFRKEDIVIDYLCDNGLLYVVVGSPDELAGQNICIDNDNLLAGREAADYLYDLGHRRIGYIGSINDFLYASDRRSGYQLSLLLHQLPVRQDYCVELESVNTADDLRALLSREDRPTAFVVSDDMLALALKMSPERQKNDPRGPEFCFILTRCESLRSFN